MSSDPVTLFDLVDPKMVVRVLMDSMTATIIARMEHEGLRSLGADLLTSLIGELARNTAQAVLSIEVFPETTPLVFRSLDDSERTRITSVRREDERLEVAVDGPPMTGRCAGCGVDLDGLRARGMTSHSCYPSLVSKPLAQQTALCSDCGERLGAGHICRRPDICDRCGLPFDRSGRTRHFPGELRAELAIANPVETAAGVYPPNVRCPRFVGHVEAWTCEGKPTV